MSCIFCKILAGEIPCNKVYENDDFLAFRDINPQAPVHLLAIPKTHVKDFNDVTPEMMAAMTTFIQEVVEKEGLKEKGYRLVNNIGGNGGQEVPHLHFHIIGGARLRWGNFV